MDEIDTRPDTLRALADELCACDPRFSSGGDEPAPHQIAAVLGKGADALCAIADEKEADAVILADPNAIHINMLRGVIAKPSPAQIVHLYERKALIAALGIATEKEAAPPPSLMDIVPDPDMPGAFMPAPAAMIASLRADLAAAEQERDQAEQVAAKIERSRQVQRLRTSEAVTRALKAEVERDAACKIIRKIIFPRPAKGFRIYGLPDGRRECLSAREYAEACARHFLMTVASAKKKVPADG